MMLTRSTWQEVEARLKGSTDIVVPIGATEQHGVDLFSMSKAPERFVFLGVSGCSQAVPLMLPPLGGVLVNLVKHSAIVSVIALADLTTEARNLISDTFMAFEIWLTTAAMYLVITVTLSLFVAWLERRYRRH